MRKQDGIIIYFIVLASVLIHTPTKEEVNPGRVQKSNLINLDEIKTTIPEKDTLQTFFDNYQNDCQLYLDRENFKGTPLSGELLKECAKETYDSTGIIVPLELALSQAQWESGMGLKGRSPKNNPYNVGEWNTLNLTTMSFNSTKDGVKFYYNLMAKKYLSKKSVEDLLKNFVNNNGHRYAHSKTYEKNISQQYYFIKRWIKKNKKV